MYGRSIPIRRTRSGCCARAASGHPTAALPRSALNLRRFMQIAAFEDKAYQRGALCVTAKKARRCRSWVSCDRRGESNAPMHVRFKPKADK
jgi:hypothetical protein